MRVRDLSSQRDVVSGDADLSDEAQLPVPLPFPRPGNTGPQQPLPIRVSYPTLLGTGPSTALPPVTTGASLPQFIPPPPARGRKLGVAILAVVAVTAASIVGVMIWQDMQRNQAAVADAGVAAVVAKPVDAPAVALVAVDAAVAIDAAPTIDERLGWLAADSRFSEAVTLCLENFTPALASACTRAACGADAKDQARAWYARVPAADRADTVTACKALWVELEPGETATKTTKPIKGKKPRPNEAEDCSKNPMACQH